jgi:hypothetical protein
MDVLAPFSASSGIICLRRDRLSLVSLLLAQLVQAFLKEDDLRLGASGPLPRLRELLTGLVEVTELRHGGLPRRPRDKDATVCVVRQRIRLCGVLGARRRPKACVREWFSSVANVLENVVQGDEPLVA